MESNKFILNFTPTGMIPTKEMTPHIPVAPNAQTSVSAPQMIQDLAGTMMAKGKTRSWMFSTWA